MSVVFADASDNGHAVLFPSITALFGRLFGHRQPLRLVMSNRTLTFGNPADFEFAMAGRVTVPFDKHLELLQRTAPQLRQEAIGIKRLEDRFVELLERCIRDPAAVTAAMQELGLKMFSKDHDWRPVIDALNQVGAEFNEYRRIALVKYLQYLGARHELLSTLYRLKTDQDLGEFPEVEPEPIPGLGMKETVIFDLMQIENAPRLLNPYERLPRGEPVLMKLRPGQTVELLLAKHRFQLVAGRPFQLIGEDGRAHPLHSGKSIVGRGTNSDVIIDNACRAVSRRHLLIEPISDSAVRLIDLSSHGTFVPPQYFGSVH